MGWLDLRWEVSDNGTRRQLYTGDHPWRRLVDGPRRLHLRRLARLRDGRGWWSRGCSAPRGQPVRPGRVGAADGGDQGRAGPHHLRADQLRSPLVLEPAGHQRRRQQVLLRRDQYARARDQRAPTDRPRDPDDRRLGPRGRLLRHRRRRRAVLRRADGALPEPVRLVQLAGLVQRRPVPPVRHPGAANNWRWDEETRTVVKADGAYEYPQGSACFIQSVRDDMEDIMRLATSEAMLFKFGSGTGTDLSTLRSSHEKLAGGGKPSGPVSFMRVYDAIASVVKSGGKTRRAAKMQSLKIWHPDILEFIECKSKEEKKAQPLIEGGYEANFNGEAYSSIMFQNANLSVRVTDGFLRRRERRRVDHPRRHHRPADGTYPGPRADGQDRRGDLALRRPRPPVRRHDPALAHLPQHRADQFVEPVRHRRDVGEHRRRVSQDRRPGRQDAILVDRGRCPPPGPERFSRRAASLSTN